MKKQDSLPSVASRAASLPAPRSETKNLGDTPRPPALRSSAKHSGRTQVLRPSALAAFGHSASRALYRSGQFVASIRPNISKPERREAARALGENLTPLFESMSPRDKRHCLDVYRTLKGQGCEDEQLLMAALLHDAGKGCLAGARVRLWHRVAYVLIGAASPRLLEGLTRGRRGSLAGLRSGLASLHRHSERGAVLAEAMGAPAEVVDLIARHEDKDPSDERLRLLWLADESC